MIKRTIQIATVLSLAASGSACSWLFGDEGYFRDRSEDYRQARVEEPLEVPEGLSKDAFEDSYVIPEIADRSRLSGEFEVPRPERLEEEISRDAVRINKLGDQQWILADGAPGQLWPRLRGFFNVYQLGIQRADAVQGILETVWLQPAAEGSIKERYRLRIDQGVQRGSSEIYVLHADIRSGDDWPPRSDNSERENLLLQELAQYLANNTAAGSVSMLAQQAIDSSGRVTIEQDSADSDPYILLKLPFFRAWASTGRALEKARFDVDDLDRSERVYLVSRSPERKEEDDGWFSGWFGGDEDEALPGIPYRLELRERDSETVELHIFKRDGQPVERAELEQLLKLIKRHLA